MTNLFVQNGPGNLYEQLFLDNIYIIAIFLQILDFPLYIIILYSVLNAS